MIFLTKYIRYFVLSSSLILSGLLYWWISYSVSGSSFVAIRLNQIYGLVALLYLYVALLASPLTQAFPQLPGRGHYLRARRAIGVSAAYFALLHSAISFWGQLGGFRGLVFLNSRYLIAIILSFIALVILTAMAMTSFNRVVSKLGYRNWKLLHRCVYLAGILIMIHVLLLGSHFSTLSNFLPQIVLVAVGCLLFLEAIRVDHWLAKKQSRPIQYWTTSIICGCIVLALVYSFTHPNSALWLGHYH
jgi:methionine sulfoxide reductase heme-binding subunit